MMVRVEMTLMLPAPLFATWMAHQAGRCQPNG
jgi:hypothetical protein